MKGKGRRRWKGKGEGGAGRVEFGRGRIDETVRKL